MPSLRLHDPHPCGAPFCTSRRQMLGAGELFVARNAGNQTDTHTLGTLVEYGAAALGVPLIVVLGHERCGGGGLRHGQQGQDLSRLDRADGRVEFLG